MNMILKKNIIYFIFLFFMECKVQNVNCNDLNALNPFLVIDTTKTYKYVDVESNLLLQFKKNGEIVYLAKSNYDNEPHKLSKKDMRGKYYLKNNKIVMDIYFRHPQGGGKVRKYIYQKKGDTIYYRTKQSCNRLYKLIPLTIGYGS